MSNHKATIINQPSRIQRKRTKGWRMPENTVYVGRGTDWGNPFKVMGDMIYLDCSHRRKILDPWVHLCFGEVKDVVTLYRHLVKNALAAHLISVHLKLIDSEGWDHRTSAYYWNDLVYWKDHFSKLELADLTGKNLGCWCPLGQPCHADVLLELANPGLEVKGEKAKVKGAL